MEMIFDTERSADSFRQPRMCWRSMWDLQAVPCGVGELWAWQDQAIRYGSTHVLRWLANVGCGVAVSSHLVRGDGLAGLHPLLRRVPVGIYAVVHILKPDLFLPVPLSSGATYSRLLTSLRFFFDDIGLCLLDFNDEDFSFPRSKRLWKVVLMSSEMKVASTMLCSPSAWYTTELEALIQNKQNKEAADQIHWWSTAVVQAMGLTGERLPQWLFRHL